MDSKDFVTKLKKIKAEILALKQAYKRGLGAANFYHAVSDIVMSGSDYVRLTIEYNTESDELPFQILSTDQYSLQGSVWESRTKRFIAVYDTTASYNMKAHIVATQPIASVLLEGLSDE